MEISGSLQAQTPHPCPITLPCLLGRPVAPLTISTSPLCSMWSLLKISAISELTWFFLSRISYLIPIGHAPKSRSWLPFLVPPPEEPLPKDWMYTEMLFKYTEMLFKQRSFAWQDVKKVCTTLISLNLKSWCLWIRNYWVHMNSRVTIGVHLTP